MSPVTPHRLLKLDLIVRCSILSQAITTMLLGWFVPSSLTAKLLADGGHYGGITLILFTACVIAGILDVFINDFLPPSIYLVWIRQRRHKIYSFLALFYFIQGFVGVGDEIDLQDLLPLGYIAIGLVSAWYSWVIAIRGSDAC